MTDLPIVQYTGEPARRQTTRIPRALWEERKAQIIALYDDHKLDEVIGKMAEAGFKANRRQYIYQLEQWGIAKYDVKRGKTPGSSDALRDKGKRKHFPAGTQNGDDHSELSYPEATVYHKKPKVAEDWVISPDDEVENEQAAADELEQPDSALTETQAARSSDSSQQSTVVSCSPASDSPKTTPREFWEFLRRHSDFADHSNREIAHQISRFATNVRPRGGYLWGTERGEGTFDIYALILETSSHFVDEDVDMAMVLSCVRSANNREACHWVSSFLEESTLASKNHPERWNALILSHLMLARKFSKYGLQTSGKIHARYALQLREKTFSSSKYEPHASCLHSFQDLYFSEVAKACDLQVEASATKSRSLWNSLPWEYSELATDVNFIRSKLLIFSTFIMGNGLELVLPCEVRSLSATLFEFVRRSPFKPLSTRWEDYLYNNCTTSSRLPDIEGACCDLLAHLFIQHSTAASAGVGDFERVDLVEIVSQMDVAQLYMDFVRAHCCRDWRCNFGDMDEQQRDEYYNISPNLIYELVQDLAIGETAVSFKLRLKDHCHWTVLPSSTKPPWTGIRVDRANTAAAVDCPLSDGPNSTSSQQCSVLRNSVDEYHRDPTWGTSCGSSIASYGDMIQARAAMNRRLQQVEEDRLAGGPRTSLPSIAMKLEEELSTSFSGLSIQET
ncbi:hypothetical protein PG989_004688 [Apiospora arundinis]